MAIRLLCLWFLLLSSSASAALSNAPAFSYHARQWSVEQGLPQVTVSAIAQDRYGFIWAGTQKGLARFDGTRFKVFDTAQNPLLRGNRIKALAVDAAGRLWIGTNKGLSVYIHGHFAKLPPVAHGLGEVNALLASDGGVWIGSDHGLFRIDKGQLQAHAVTGWTAQGAESIVVDPRGNLWVAVTDGVYKRSQAGTRFRFYALADKALSARTLAYFHDRLWVGTNRGLYTLDHQRLRATQPRLARRSIRALLAGPSGYLWIGTDASLYRLDSHDRLIDFSATSGLEDKWVWALTTDRTGDLWVGTGTHGMIRLWGNHITWFAHSSGLTSALVDAVYRDRDGSILVGGKSGAYRYRNGRFQQIHSQADLPSPLVHSFLRDQRGRLWIGTTGGLAITQSGHGMALPAPLTPLAHANIYNLRQDRDGTIWIATTRGLYRYRQKQLRRFGKQDGLSEVFVRSTYRFDAGPLWVGTARGLFERTHKGFRRLCQGQHLDGQVLNVSRGAHASRWIAAADGSLFKYASGHCTRYTFKANPLAGSLYYAIQDHHGNLWLSNDTGIYRIAIGHLKDYTSSHTRRMPERGIQTADGLHQIHPVGGTAQAGLLDPDGNFWVPTINGMIVVDIDRPPSAAASAPVVIENVSRGANTFPVTQPLSSVTFHPGKTDLRIDYASLEFRTPESVRYSYRLSGYDSTWVNAGTRKEALYTHLPPGHYRFEVRTDTADGAKSTQTAALNLTLEPFFYQTWWFYLAVGVLAACLVYAAYHLRMRHVRSRQSQLEMLIATRTEELREANRKLQQVSMTDPLTGLRNRRFFVDTVKKDVAALQREASAGAGSNDMVFLILDLDDFKRINDNYGHQAGDAVLTQLSGLLTDSVRASDDVIRWGGEEFLIIARQTDRKRAVKLAESLRASIASHAFKVGDTETTSCTCSIGFCAFPFVPGGHDRPTWEGIVNLADAALYAAKRRGKNAWAGVQPTDAASTAEPHELQPELDTLLEKGWATLEVFDTSDTAALLNADG